MKKTVLIVVLFITVYYGNSQITETTDGKVGIGITTPKGKLHVNGSIYGGMGEGFKLFGDVNYFGQYLDGIIFQMEDANGTGGNTDGGFVFRGYTPKDEKFKEWMTIKTGGKVGIGTLTPSENLSVFGNAARFSVTGVSGNSAILMGNQNSGGVNNPSVIWAANGNLFFGGGNSWNRGGTLSTAMSVADNGNVGIGTGTATPSRLLEIKQKNDPNSDSALMISEPNNSQKIYLHLANNSTGEYGFFSLGADTNLRGNGQLSTFKGSVGIGTKNTKGFKLGVNGKIAATEVKVATYANWADFVFKNDYDLPSLKEVENHIKENGHLANIPSAEEVKKNGFFLGEMDAKLLQKIEELTLYTIQQEKELRKASTNNDKLLSIIEKLEKRIEKLENK
ncbi:DUF4200 domain-containing protein [Tenacibaculum agarivorans]|uniref:DUF4200 domain-containing protein n=1 Tax=Tenacibaculum agarivorans TaxID=1908389 RepID=UPI00094BB0C5|nr:DUF4200 domain-containing protein [Tenacibaculum agarivorans]